MEFTAFGLGNGASLVKRDVMLMTWERVGSWHQSDQQDTRLARLGMKGIC